MPTRYAFSLLNGLRIDGRLVTTDTKPDKLLSALLIRVNTVVSGEDLVAAGWSDDPAAGDIKKIRGNKAALDRHLASGTNDYVLSPKGSGAYHLTLDDQYVDLHDALRRRDLARAFRETGDPVAALRQLEPVVGILLKPVTALGVLKRGESTTWDEEIEDAEKLRRQVLGDYFGIAFDTTNFDAHGFLRALESIDLASLPLQPLWLMKIGLTSELVSPAAASEVLSAAKIALNRLSVNHEFDSGSTAVIADEIAQRLRAREGKPVYQIVELDNAGAAAQSPRSPARVSAMRTDLQAEAEHLMGRKVTGSSMLTLRDMVTNPALRMPARATVRSGSDRLNPISDVLTHLTEKLTTSREQYLIVAPPGAGKSLICRLIFLALAARADTESGTVPVLVDLRGADLKKAAALAKDRDIVLIDSLDELLAAGRLEDVRRTISADVLEHCDVIACRTQFYEQFLTGSTMVENRTVIEIRAWDIPTIEAYIDAYHRHVSDAVDSGVVADLKRRLESPNVESLLSIPLRLNMALDLIPPGENNLPIDLNSLSLHRQWIEQTLRNEAARGGSILTAPDKLEYLTTLSWRFYDEGTPGRQAAPSFTDAELRKELGTDILFEAPADEVKRTARDLEFHSILIPAEQGGLGTTQFDSFEFMHKTFQEFLVARYIIQAAKSGPEAAASVFRRYLSPQVSDFIKDEIKFAARGSGLAPIARNLQGALSTYDREAASSPDPRLRSTIQQVCYYLAALPLDSIRESMLDRLSSESDPWIRRAIAIGLSFGGVTLGLDQYIETLRRERELGRSTDSNDLNIGFHLSFFGDQPFDPVQPYVDRGLDSVSSTVSRLIYQLSIETDFGSWRLDLHTMIDIYRHRPVSRKSCTSTIKENRDRLNWVLRQFQMDPRTSAWPEVTDLRALLKELEILDD